VGLGAVRHQDRVDVLPGTPVVPFAVALALEAEALVELDRGLVPREDVQLDLADAARARPVDGGREQGAADALTAGIRPRSATWELAGCESRASDRRPMIAPSLRSAT